MKKDQSSRGLCGQDDRISAVRTPVCPFTSKMELTMMNKPTRAAVLVLTLWLGFLLPVSGLALEPLQPESKDRCAVCGMMVSPFPNWIAAVAFKDGSHYFFDGPKDMFNFILDLQQYRPGATAADIAEVQVTEYYTVQRYDAREVFFVTGSDVMGPMGKELVPVAGDQALKTFMLDHGYDKVMRFDGEELAPVAALP